MDNQNLFGQTYAQLQAQVTGAGNANFQMLVNPIDFSWPVPPTGQLSPLAYQLMSVMPAYSAIGAYSPSDARMFDAYARVMTFISFKVDPQKVADLQGLQDQVTNARNRVDQDTIATNTAYQTALASGGDVFKAMYPDIAAWLKGPGSTYANTIASDTDLANTLQAQYAKLAAAISTDPRLQADFAAIQKPTGSVGGAAPDGWTRVPRGDGQLEWQPDFTVGTTGQDWRAKLSSGSVGAFSLELDASKSSSALEESWASASASVDAFFWSVNTSGSWQRSDFSESDNTVSAQISVQASTFVPITPGSWYDGGLLRSLARNDGGYGAKLVSPWVAQGDSQAVFGKNGVLPTRVTGLVVAFKPSYSISMQSSTYAKFEQTIKASAGVRIGPFNFGGSGGHHTIDISATGNRTQLSGSSDSDDPVIIGLTVAFPGIE